MLKLTADEYENAIAFIVLHRKSIKASFGNRIEKMDREAREEGIEGVDAEMIFTIIGEEKWNDIKDKNIMSKALIKEDTNALGINSDNDAF